MGGIPLNGYNRHGGLTLVPMPGFEGIATTLKGLIEAKTKPHKTAVDITTPKFGLRPSGEPYVQLAKDHIGGHDVVVLTSGPGTYEMLGQLLLLLGYLTGRRAARISIMTGYFPLVRSDKDEGNLELALTHHMVHLLQAATYGKLDRIISFDLHSAQAVMSGPMGLITEISLMARVLERALRDALETGHNICMMYPDGTAQKRYKPALEQAATRIGRTFPSVTVEKDRIDGSTTKVNGISGATDAVEGSLLISVDDEWATGGTAINGAAQNRERYGLADCWAVVAHGVLCDPGPSRLAHHDCAVSRLYISGSIPICRNPELAPLVDGGRLVVVPWEQDLANILLRHHWDESIRELR